MFFFLSDFFYFSRIFFISYAGYLCKKCVCVFTMFIIALLVSCMFFLFHFLSIVSVSSCCSVLFFTNFIFLLSSASSTSSTTLFCLSLFRERLANVLWVSCFFGYAYVCVCFSDYFVLISSSCCLSIFVFVFFFCPVGCVIEIRRNTKLIVIYYFFLCVSSLQFRTVAPVTSLVYVCLIFLINIIRAFPFPSPVSLLSSLFTPSAFHTHNLFPIFFCNYFGKKVYIYTTKGRLTFSSVSDLTSTKYVFICLRVS